MAHETVIFFIVFLSHSRIYLLIWRRHHDWERSINFDLYSALMAIEYWGLNSLACHTYTPTVTRAIRLKWSSPRTRDTHTCCRTFSSIAVTTCFKNLLLSRPRFENQNYVANGLTECATAVAFVLVQCRDGFIELIVFNSKRFIKISNFWS